MFRIAIALLALQVRLSQSGEITQTSYFPFGTLRWRAKVQELSKDMTMLRLTTITVALLLASCGSGSEGDSNGSAPSVDYVPIQQDQPTPTPGVMTPQPGQDTEQDTEQEAATSPAEDSSVPDPMTPNLVRINFLITVPAYVSNELQVGILWNLEEIKAEWIGDEFWQAVDDFPADEEHTLIVNFYDRNGDITLGTVERIFRTGVNSAEDVSITIDDFDTERWDDDSDGVSNIEELRLGTDPLVADVPLEPGPVNLSDTINVAALVGDAVSYYEPEVLTLTLPVDIHDEEFEDNLPYNSTTIITDILLSADGDGTYSQTYDFFIALDTPFHRSTVGTRSSQDDTVSWSGTSMYRGSSRYYGAVEEEFETSSTIAGRELVQESSGTATFRRAAYEDSANILRYDYEIVLDLDSMDSENTCAVLRGNISQSFERQIEYSELTELTVGRSSSDEHWAWSSTTDGEVTSGEAINLRDRFYCNFLFNQE